MVGEEGSHGEDHARRAEPALERVALAERLLDRVERVAGAAEPFDRGHVGALGLHGEEQAGAHGLAVEQDRAAPQTPCSQPTWVPVRPRSSRKASTRFVRVATSSVTWPPLTTNVTACRSPAGGVTP